MSGRGGRSEPPGIVVHWIRFLLLAWPDAFRRRFAESMEDSFRERWAESHDRGRLAAAGLLLRTSADLLRSGLAERFTGLSLHWIGGDLRIAVRSLLRRPGFAAVAVLTLALGIGANTAIFSVVNGVLLRPLPWPDQDRLVTIWSAGEKEPTRRGSMSRPDLLDIEATDAFDRAVGWSPTALALTGMGDAEAVQLARVTSGVFDVFGLRPTLGRDLTLADTERGSTDVVVLTHSFWRDRMGADPAVVGQTIELQGVPRRIVGVGPEGFAYPTEARMWLPQEHQPDGCGRDCYTLNGIARLAPGWTLAAAEAEIGAMAERLQAAYPDSNFERVFNLVMLEEYTVGSVRRGLWMLLGAVGLVLLIACANVANLLLARAQTRSGEVAVRAALGASGGRLAGQVLIESMLLAGLGGAAGLALAYVGVDLLRTISAGAVPRIDEVTVDGSVLVFTLGLVGMVALLFGLTPAIRLAGSQPAAALTSAGRGGTGSAGAARSRTLLLTVEVALSLMLLVGAGLLLKSFARIYAVEPGFETERIVRFTLSLPVARYPTDDLPKTVSFYRELESRLAAEPGVDAVGSTYGAPLGRGNIAGDVQVQGRPAPARGEETSGSIKAITPGYLEVMRIPLLSGRALGPGDDAGAEPVALVNETLARETFPGEDPIGQRVQITASFGYTNPIWTIVGTVADVRTRSLTQAPRAEIFVPQAQFGPGFMTVAARVAPNAPPLAPAIREHVRALDPAVPIQSLETIEEAVARDLAAPRFYLILVGAFAGLAAVLAAVGLYGVASFLVSRRTREIGVRMALGARRNEIVRLVVGQGLRPAGFGVALGLAGAWFGSRVLESLLFDVRATDPVVYVGVAALLLAVVVLACLVPARHAARVDPVQALRAE